MQRKYRHATRWWRRGGEEEDYDGLGEGAEEEEEEEATEEERLEREKVEKECGVVEGDKRGMDRWVRWRLWGHG